MLDFIQGPWHWSVSGLLISGVMFTLLYAGKEFGVSSNLRTMCTIAGAGKQSDFFKTDWKARRWNLLFVAGAVIGGFLATTFLANPDPVAISTATESWLATLNIDAPSSGTQGDGYVPHEMFRFESFHMYGIIGTAVVTGAIGVALAKRMGWKTVDGEAWRLHPKDFTVPRYILGGTIFGLGWAMTGACPGPMFTLLGQGVWAIGLVILASVFGTFVYGLLRSRLPH